MDGKLGTSRTRNVSGDLIGFIRAYRARYNGDTPSLGELANAVRSTKPAVSRMLDRLQRDGALVRLPGPPRRKRRIILPDEKDRALALLRSIGFVVNSDALSGALPATVTESILPLAPLIEQIDRADEELRRGGKIGEEDE
jgi:DNA-binding MarR family transcriptional regulator